VQAGRRAGGQAWQAWQGPRPVWDKDDWHPQIDDRWVERADCARWPLHMLVLYCIGLVWVGLVWSGLVCCVALPWVALPWPARREAEPERRAERSRISQCCQRNRNSRATAHDRLGSARRGKTRGSGQRAAGSGQGRGQSRAPARNVTSTWGLGARLWRRPITRSVVCRAALILVARPPPARRPLVTRGSWQGSSGRLLTLAASPSPTMVSLPSYFWSLASKSPD
jgi:hypothetical protein